MYIPARLPPSIYYLPKALIEHMTQDTVRLIEESIQRDREHIELANSLERLKTNRDFKQVISEGYLNKEAVRLVHLKADPSMQNQESQASIVSQIDAIGGLLAYFRLIAQMGDQAVKSMERSEFERDELLAEEIRRG